MIFYNDLKLSELKKMKEELECSDNLQALFSLIVYYNDNYSDNCDCLEARLLLGKINNLLSDSLVMSYIRCVNEINDICKDGVIFEDGLNFEVIDMSLRRFVLYKNI